MAHTQAVSAAAATASAFCPFMCHCSPQRVENTSRGTAQRIKSMTSQAPDGSWQCSSLLGCTSKVKPPNNDASSSSPAAIIDYGPWTMNSPLYCIAVLCKSLKSQCLQFLDCTTLPIGKTRDTVLILARCRTQQPDWMKHLPTPDLYVHVSFDEGVGHNYECTVNTWPARVPATLQLHCCAIVVYGLWIQPYKTTGGYTNESVIYIENFPTSLVTDTSIYAIKKSNLRYLSIVSVKKTLCQRLYNFPH